MIKKIFIGVLCVVFSGCATRSTHVSKSNVAKIKKGETTQAEVLKVFGPPDVMSLNQDGDEIFTYTDIQARNSVWNYFPVLSFVHSEMKITDLVLTIVFKDNVVEDYTFSSTKTAQKIECGLIP